MGDLAGAIKVGNVVEGTQAIVPESRKPAVEWPIFQVTDNS